jgi:cytochrome P450
VCVYLAQRHPDFWSRPDDFVPERFVGAAPAVRSAFFPFGLGPRACAGAEFAMTEMTLVLTVLAGAFDLALLSPDPAPRAGITLRPDRPIRARVHRVR